jgi:hypothetical protein
MSVFHHTHCGLRPENLAIFVFKPVICVAEFYCTLTDQRFHLTCLLFHHNTFDWQTNAMATMNKVKPMTTNRQVRQNGEMIVTGLTFPFSSIRCSKSTPDSGARETGKFSENLWLSEVGWIVVKRVRSYPPTDAQTKGKVPSGPPILSIVDCSDLSIFIQLTSVALLHDKCHKVHIFSNSILEKTLQYHLLAVFLD